MNIIQFELKTVLEKLRLHNYMQHFINNFQNDMYSVKILIPGNLMENLTDFLLLLRITLYVEHESHTCFQGYDELV